MQDVARDYGLPVVAIATLDDLLHYLATPTPTRRWPRIAARWPAYRERYGV